MARQVKIARYKGDIFVSIVYCKIIFNTALDFFRLILHCDTQINKISRDILLLMLKGREQMGEAGWSKTIKAVIPVLHLLQCHADTDTSLGQCITSLFDPDVARSILLPSIEVISRNSHIIFWLFVTCIVKTF